MADLTAEPAALVRMLDSVGMRRYGAPPTHLTGGWFRLADRVGDSAAMDAWLAAELAWADGHADLAGAVCVYRFSAVLAEICMIPLIEAGQALELGTEDCWFGMDDGVRIGAVGLAPRGVRVGDEASLAAVAAVTAVAVYEPLTDAVRARTPFGRRGMWGTLADHLAAVAVRRAIERAPGNLDAAWAAWQTAAQVIDEIARRQPLLVARPRAFEATLADPAAQLVPPAGVPAPGPSRGSVFAEKSTCCLIYKRGDVATSGTARDTRRAQVVAHACTACPLRDDADRRGRLQEHLARTLAASAAGR